MKNEAKARVEDIQHTAVSKTYTIADKEVHVRIENAMTGMVNDKRVLLDEDLLNKMIDRTIQSVKQNYSKYNPVPNEIIFRCTSGITTEKKAVQEQTGKLNHTKADVIESYEPRFDLKQIALNEKVREQIYTAISAVRHRKKMEEEWGMSGYFYGNRSVILNFYGKPGTGKSMSAEAIAKALGKRVYRINYSELESKYVGETPKNIRKVFEGAARDNAVLVFDEADSFLGKRLSSVTQSADYGVNITRSVLLMELEKFTCVVVFTTNLVTNYDEAFKRRILLSIYFEMPDEQARKDIWKLHLSDKMPLDKALSADSLARRYKEVSGADIKDMVFYAALYILEKNKDTIDFTVFDYAYTAIHERYVNKDTEPVAVSVETITEAEYHGETNGGASCLKK